MKTATVYQRSVIIVGFISILVTLLRFTEPLLFHAFVDSHV